MKTGCGPTDFIPDVETEDKINLLVKDGYYGHPNPKRAAVDGDPRQCVWRSPYDESDADFTAPLLRVPASTDGIIEWQSDHFDKQLRGNLSKYTMIVISGPRLELRCISCGLSHYSLFYIHSC